MTQACRRQFKILVLAGGLLMARLCAQNFAPTGPMNLPRFSHQATLLADGRILVTGGESFLGGPGATNTAEMYDPAMGTWRYTNSPMSVARSLHTATRLPNGRVLIAGGFNDSGGGINILSSAEIFDPVAETFTVTAGMATRRSGHNAILLQDGRVLVISGDNRDFGGLATTTCELFQPATATWGPAAQLPIGLWAFAAVRLNDGKPLVVGGLAIDAGFADRSSMYRYDPMSNAWQTLTPMLVARTLPVAEVLPDGRVLIAGGTNIFSVTGYNSAEIYDVAAAGGAGQTAFTGFMSTPRRGHRSVSLANGDIMVAGGVQGGVGSLSSAEIFSAATGTWTNTGSMLDGREAHTLTLMSSGQVLVAGGIKHNPTFENPVFLRAAEIWGGGCLEVPIDIKPGSYPNTINLGSGGTVPVAILSTATFDATTVNPASVTLAGAAVKLKSQGAVQAATQDINGDGRPDLVAHVVTEVLQLSSSDTEAVLQATTFAGQCVTGRDTVRIVP